MMPKIAEGSANKVWVIPSEITKAMEGLGSSIHEIAGIPREATPRKRVDMGPMEPQVPSSAPGAGSSTNKAVQDAIAAAEPGAMPTGAAAPANRRSIRPSRRARPRGAAHRESVRGRAVTLAGVAAGTINTVVGSGTLITFPTLLAFGVPPVTANVPTPRPGAGQVSGVVGYRRELAGQLSRVLRLAPRP